MDLRRKWWWRWWWWRWWWWWWWWWWWRWRRPRNVCWFREGRKTWNHECRWFVWLSLSDEEDLGVVDKPLLYIDLWSGIINSIHLLPFDHPILLQRLLDSRPSTLLPHASPLPGQQAQGQFRAQDHRYPHLPHRTLHPPSDTGWPDRLRQTGSRRRQVSKLRASDPPRESVAPHELLTQLHPLLRRQRTVSFDAQVPRHLRLKMLLLWQAPDRPRSSRARPPSRLQAEDGRDVRQWRVQGRQVQEVQEEIRSEESL